MSAKFQPEANPNAETIPPHTTRTGNQTLSIPSAIPPMITVAGPVSD
jgi:hypothetical protein